MSCSIVKAEGFDAFLKCETKAHFKSAGQTGEPDELVNSQREVRRDFDGAASRSIFQDAFDASQGNQTADLATAS